MLRQPVFVCQGCGFVVSEQLLKMRLDRKLNWVDCPVCAVRISLQDGKIETNDFDVFVAYN